MAKERVHKGEKYSEMIFPQYRKLSEDNLYFIPNKYTFVNVLHVRGVLALSTGELTPMAVTDMFTRTAQSSADEFNKLYTLAIGNIQSIYAQ